jgi:hypothetical protein
VIAVDTTRKASHIAETLEAGRVAGVTLAAPAASYLTTAEPHIERIHPTQCVDAICTGSDPAMGDDVASSLSSDLRHAKPRSGDGFCAANGLVIAALAHMERHSDYQFVIVDVDAHSGGGAALCLDSVGLTDRVRRLDIFTDPFDRYEPVRDNDIVVGGAAPTSATSLASPGCSTPSTGTRPTSWSTTPVRTRTRPSRPGRWRHAND